MRAWMKKLFDQFERLRHDIENVWEVIVQMVRNIWPSPKQGRQTGSKRADVLGVQDFRHG